MIRIEKSDAALRILANFIDFSVGVFLLFFTHEISYLHAHNWAIFEFLGFKNSGAFNPLNLLFWYLISKPMTALFTGRTPGQIALGYLNKCDNYNRVRGFIRESLNFFLTPFIIFDLPLLAGKKTVAESWSGTSLELDLGLFGRIRAGVCFIFAILMLYLSPLFVHDLSHVHYFGHLKKIDGEKLSNKTQFKHFKNYSSHHFGMTSFTSLGDNKIIPLPVLDLVKKKKSKSIYPSVVFGDLNTESTITFKVEKVLNMATLIELGAKGNPLFSSTYPLLSLMINKYRLKGKWESDIQKEARRLISSVMDLGTNQVRHFFSNGPFVFGQVKLGKELNRLIFPFELKKIGTVTISKTPFLKMVGTRISMEREEIKQILIPLDRTKAKVYSWTYYQTENNKKFIKLLEQTLLAQSKFPAMDKKAYQYDDFGFFEVLDFFAYNFTSRSDRADYEKRTYQYFFEAGKTLVLGNRPSLSYILESQLDRVISIVEVMNRSKKKVFGKNFSQLLMGIREAIKAKNRQYFVME